MKHMLLIAALSTAALAAHSQTDNTPTPQEKVDTIRIGNMVIVKRGGGDSTSYSSSNRNSRYEFDWNRNRKPRRVQTSWFNFDIGYSNINDQTNYSSAEAKEYARAIRPGEPAFTSSDFNLRNGRSTNLNLWIFRQKYGLTADRKLKLTYGLIMEWNNFRFDDDLRTSYKKGSTPYVFRDSVTFSKNKLALDYFTVPLMIGFDSKPGRGGFTISAGASLGYLYSSRTKQISDERNKQKVKGNFDIKPWRVQYVAEVGFGPVKLYGAYTPTTIYERGLDHRPYAVGLRLGDWD